MNLSKSLIFISLISLLVFSCNKDNSNNGNSNDPSNSEIGTFSAKIDGKNFNGILTSASFAEIPDTLGPFQNVSTLGITGSDLPNGFVGVTISIYFPVGETLEAKSYQFFDDCIGNILNGSFCGNLSYVGEHNGVTSNENGNLSVTFSTIDLREGGICIGTFSGIAIDSGESRTISDGKFNLIIK